MATRSELSHKQDLPQGHSLSADPPMDLTQGTSSPATYVSYHQTYRLPSSQDNARLIIAGPIPLTSPHQGGGKYVL